MELFLSYYPSNKTRDGLMEIIDQIGRQGKGVAHRYETLHCTLSYLGEVSEERYAELVALLREVGSRHAPFDMTGSGKIWLFPDTSVYNARSFIYLWENNPEVQAVFDDVIAELTKHGFWFADHGGFLPHSTLYMSYHPETEPDEIQPAPVFHDRFDCIVLYQCTEIDGHVAYYPLFVQPLEG